MGLVQARQLVQPLAFDFLKGIREDSATRLADADEAQCSDDLPESDG